MKLLITGGCGFLGSNLAAHAIKNGWETTLFDNLHRNGSIDNLAWLRGQGEFRFCHGDIRNRNDLSRIMDEVRPDAVFHLAGQVAMTTSIANIRLDFEVNVGGTFNLLEAVREHAPDATVVYSSTNKVYGDLEQYQYIETNTRYECTEKPNGFDETTPLEFHSPYGCSKGAADQYMLDFSRIFGLKTIVFRHSSMYGGRQFATCDQGWIGWFCRQALETRSGKLSEPFTISGSGKQVRDLLHADDMINLYFLALKKVEAARGHAFNVGGGIANSLSLLELFAMLEGKLGVKFSYRHLPPRESDQRVFVADIFKAKRLLGWEPKVFKSNGISLMLDWIEYGR